MFVHGAWHGSWCWDPVRRALEADGLVTAAVDNPSVTAPGSDLHADGDNLRAALDAIDGPVVLVGHSYGGAVISDAGTHPNVEHLVYLTAFPLDTGESAMENALVGGEDMKLPEALVFDGDMITLEPSRVVEFFFHDCAPAIAAAAAAQLRPMSLAAMAAASRAAAWRDKPSTYVVCTDDRAIPVALQRSAAERAGAVAEIPTSHSPFLSRPDDLARMLAGFATR
jgi:pimeloyl-ACP methyl ester carboxylesterase